MSNPLLRTFVEKVTEKSFDKGLLWGTANGVFVTHFYTQDKYKKLERKYSDVKHKLHMAQLKRSRGYAEAPQDGVSESR